MGHLAGPPWQAQQSNASRISWQRVPSAHSSSNGSPLCPKSHGHVRFMVAYVVLKPLQVAPNGHGTHRSSFDSASATKPGSHPHPASDSFPRVVAWGGQPRQVRSFARAGHGCNMRRSSIGSRATSRPGFCLPGNFVWATGLIGGVKRHLGFKASVVKLRNRYPRIHVRYEADRVGNTGAINLLEIREAYLMSDAIAEYA